MKGRILIICAAICTLVCSCQDKGKYEYPFQNPKLKVEERIDNLMSLLTLEEKVSLMVNQSKAIDRLGVPAYNWWGEACHGIHAVTDVTVFPQCIGLAATFDDEAQLTTYTMISDEARGRFNSIPRVGDLGTWTSGDPNLTFWCPNINIFRDPRWGRGQETYGEDPYLMSQMGLRVVLGMQGDDPKYFKTHACAKHYAVHSGPEPTRHQFNTYASMRDLWETYLPAFKTLVVEGNVQEVMCAYTTYEGQPCCANDRLLTDILRNRWNYQGIILTDCDAMQDFFVRGRHMTHPDAVTADADAVLHGTDLECGRAYLQLVESVQKGLISEADIDVSLRRVLNGRFTLGLFDPDEVVPYHKIPGSVVDCDEHHKQAYKMASEGIVMLKNANNTLPLSKSVKKVAVVGPNADDIEVMRGTYTSDPSYFVSILQGLKNKLPGAEVTYIRGCEIDNDYIQTPKMQQVTAGGKKGFLAQYYANTNFAGAPIVTDNITEINYRTDGGRGFGQGIPAYNFSAKYSGDFVADFTGTLCFNLRANNCVIKVNGKQVAKTESSMYRGQNLIPIEVKEGQKYAIEILYTGAAQEGGMSIISFDMFQREWAEFDDVKAQVADADVIVFAGGISPSQESEGRDRATIELPNVQKRLLQAMKSTGKPVVMLSTSGSCIGFEESEPYFDALLQVWYSGQEGGNAIADILFGDVSPSGKLPVTFYKSTAQLPELTDYSMDNRTYRYFKGEPMWAFGYGMSYTTFDFGKAKLSKASIKAGQSVDITVPVTNSGKMDADEVVQVYVKSLDNPDAPIKALKAYKRVSVAAGKTANVKLTLVPDSFAYYSEDVDDLKVLPGRYQILYGNSSADKDLQALDFQVL